MPELAAMYSVGLIVFLVIFGSIYFFELKKQDKPEYKNLQQNLSLIQKRWSDSSDNIVDLESQDGLSFLKSLLMFASFCFFLSWIGLFFFILIYTSLVYLKNPKKKVLMKGPLGQNHLSKEQVQELIQLN